MSDETNRKQNKLDTTLVSKINDSIQDSGQLAFEFYNRRVNPQNKMQLALNAVRSVHYAERVAPTIMAETIDGKEVLIPHPYAFESMNSDKGATIIDTLDNITDYLSNNKYTKAVSEWLEARPKTAKILKAAGYTVAGLTALLIAGCTGSKGTAPTGGTDNGGTTPTPANTAPTLEHAYLANADGSVNTYLVQDGQVVNANPSSRDPSLDLKLDFDKNVAIADTTNMVLQIDGARYTVTIDANNDILTVQSPGVWGANILYGFPSDSIVEANPPEGKDALSLEDNLEFTYSTGNLPRVSGINFNGTDYQLSDTITGIARDGNILVPFSEAVQEDTFEATDVVKVTKKSDGSTHNVTINYDADNNRGSIDYSNLDPNETYILTIDDTVLSVPGFPLDGDGDNQMDTPDDFSIEFTTAPLNYTMTLNYYFMVGGIAMKAEGVVVSQATGEKLLDGVINLGTGQHEIYADNNPGQLALLQRFVDNYDNLTEAEKLEVTGAATVAEVEPVFNDSDGINGSVVTRNPLGTQESGPGGDQTGLYRMVAEITASKPGVAKTTASDHTQSQGFGVVDNNEYEIKRPSWDPRSQT